MTETIYLLWFMQERQEAADIELLIGAFASKADAERAIEQLKPKPGFAAYSKGFHLDAQQIGESGWTEGFISDSE